MRIIGFNGPPRSGKDTLASAVAAQCDFDQRVMKDLPTPLWGQPTEILSRALIMPCRLAAFAFMGRPYDSATYEAIKDVEQAAFNGETLRRFMIRLSEEHLKRNYGQHFYGNCLAESIEDYQVRDNSILMLVTDIGFQSEVDVLMNVVGPENFLLVRVKRNETTWKGDSRGYCIADQIFDYTNNVSPDRGATYIMRHASNELGWEF